MNNPPTTPTTAPVVKNPLQQVGGRTKPTKGRRSLYSYMEGLRQRGLTPERAAPLAIAFMQENVRRRIAVGEMV